MSIKTKPEHYSKIRLINSLVSLLDYTADESDELRSAIYELIEMLMEDDSEEYEEFIKIVNKLQVINNSK